MNTLYKKAVELLIDDIQDKVLKEKINALGKEAEIEINEPSKNNIFYDGLIETSIPLTRKERRKLERKKKK